MSGSFLEKLKKGMEIKNIPSEKTGKEEAPEEYQEEKKEIKIKKRKQIKPLAMPKIIISQKNSEPVKEKTATKIKKARPSRLESEKGLNKFEQEDKNSEKMIIKVEKEKPQPKENRTEVENKIEKKGWFEQEGQLVVDVYETENEVVIQSAIAGVEPEDLDISIEKDMVSIRGERKETMEKNKKNYFYKECYWGRFSKEIILPAEVDNSRADAKMKNGIITIRLPKIERERKRKIFVKIK